MKNFFIFSFLLLSLSAFADSSEGEKAIRQERIQSEVGDFSTKPEGYCRYEIHGKGVTSEGKVEDKLMKFEECKKIAEHFFKTAGPSFSQLRIKHQSKAKWVEIKK